MPPILASRGARLRIASKPINSKEMQSLQSLIRSLLAL